PYCSPSWTGRARGASTSRSWECSCRGRLFASGLLRPESCSTAGLTPSDAPDTRWYPSSMSWSLKRKARALLEGEGGVVRKEWGGRVSVALVYPNTSAAGMSNLGFQTIYDHLNRRADAVCERVFFPDPEDVDEYARTGTAPFSLESQRPLADFDLIGFSVTYEGDYINVARLLTTAGPPLRAADRRPGDTVILMGGVCAFSNPEPVAPFMDVIVVGEGEEVVGEIVDAYRRTAAEASPQSGRARFVRALGPLAGIYVPEAHAV